MSAICEICQFHPATQRAAGRRPHHSPVTEVIAPNCEPQAAHGIPTQLSRRVVLGALGASPGMAGIATESVADTAAAAANPCADPEEPVLPRPTMTLDLSRTARVIIDPQIDFLNPKGKAWGAFGGSITEPASQLP